MVIIMANSCAGTPIFLKGLSICSIPSVKTIGVVVSVSKEVMLTNNTKRVPMKSAMVKPSLVAWRNFHCQTISAGGHKRLQKHG